MLATTTTARRPSPGLSTAPGGCGSRVRGGSTECATVLHRHSHCYLDSAFVPGLSLTGHFRRRRLVYWSGAQAGVRRGAGSWEGDRGRHPALAAEESGTTDRPQGPARLRRKELIPRTASISPLLKKSALSSQPGTPPPHYEDLLARVLYEVIYLLEVHDRLPVATSSASGRVERAETCRGRVHYCARRAGRANGYRPQGGVPA